MEEKEIDVKDNLEEDFRKEILKNIDKKLSKEEIQKLSKEVNENLNFLQKIDEVELPSDNYVIFTDGDEQLYYENGEFYVISTTDGKKARKKKSKKEATDMYLNYFIKYQLNPILDVINADKDRTKDIVKEKAKTRANKQKVEVEIKTEETPVVEKESEQKVQKIVKEDREI